MPVRAAWARRRFSSRGAAAAACPSTLNPRAIQWMRSAALWRESAVEILASGVVPGAMGGHGLMGLCYCYARKYNVPVEQRFDL